MKTLLVQDYLRSGNGVDKLYAEHAVKAAQPYNGKMSFNYDQLEVKETDPLANQCRGLILRENTWDVVAVPFFRFFNYGQPGAADIDWNTARFQDKKDGSFLIVYYDFNQNKWFCATRSMCEAHGNVSDYNITYAQLANMASKKYGVDNINDLMNKGTDSWKNCTFKFELTSPYNRIVCQYDEVGLTLLGVRDNISFQEYNTAEYSHTLGVPMPDEYEFANINHMIQVIKDWNPSEKEGVVVVDEHFNRIKVKNPSYTAYNKLHDSLSTSWRGAVEIILLEKEDDVIPMMSKPIADRIIKLKGLIAEVLHRTHMEYEEIRHIDDMKEFSFATRDKLWPAALFALKRNKTPDLHTFATGQNKKITSFIPKNALETMLDLCKKLDPALKEIEIKNVE